MRLGKDLVGKPIISIDEGRHIGDAKDLYLDRDLNEMTGIHLGREGLLRRKDTIIPRASVVVYGVDAILVETGAAVTDSNEKDIEDWVKLADLTGRSIDTPGGTKLATVGDVILDVTGQIIGFSLAKVAVDGPIADNRAIARQAVLDNGHTDGIMTIDINLAEQLGLPQDPTVVPDLPAEE